MNSTPRWIARWSDGQPTPYGLDGEPVDYYTISADEGVDAVVADMWMARYGLEHDFASHDGLFSRGAADLTKWADDGYPLINLHPISPLYTTINPTTRSRPHVNYAAQLHMA